jgi:hypothetical protein
MSSSPVDAPWFASGGALKRVQPSESVVALVPAEAFDLLKSLNGRGEMVPSFQGQKRGYGGLDRKNCFGFRFTGGARVVGESSGRDYGMYQMSDGAPMRVEAVMIGFLYSEANLIVSTASLAKGSYIVFLGPEALTFKGKELASTEVRLSSRLSDSILSTKKPPRFSLIQEAGGIALVVEGNKLFVEPNTMAAGARTGPGGSSTSGEPGRAGGQCRTAAWPWSGSGRRPAPESRLPEG